MKGEIVPIPFESSFYELVYDSVNITHVQIHAFQTLGCLVHKDIKMYNRIQFAIC